MFSFGTTTNNQSIAFVLFCRPYLDLYFSANLIIGVKAADALRHATYSYSLTYVAHFTFSLSPLVRPNVAIDFTFRIQCQLNDLAFAPLIIGRHLFHHCLALSAFYCCFESEVLKHVTSETTDFLWTDLLSLFRL
jgi:hypothetical protein